MKGIILFILLNFFFYSVNAQNQLVRVLADNDSDVFKMVWMPKNWPDSLQGFHVKVSADQINWKPITSEPLIPEVVPNNSTPFVFGNDKAADSIKAGISELIQNNNLKLLSRDVFKEDIFSNQDEIESLGFLFAFELDAFMYAGFGLIDYAKHYEGDYYYGLFPLYSNSLSNNPIYTYHYTEPLKEKRFNLDFKSGLALKGKNKLLVKWEFDGYRFKQEGLKGVNLFLDNGLKTEKLNDKVVYISNRKENSILVREFDLGQLTDNVIFSIEPVSYLNFTGERSSIKFSKSDIVKEVEAPKIDMVKSGMNDEGTGVEIVWDFSEKGKNSFDQLIVERKMKGKEFVPIDSVSSDTEVFTDFPQSDNTYYYYRVVAEPKLGNKLISNTYLGYFQLNPQPDVPQNLEGSFRSEGDERFIALSWLSNKDDITEGYHVYSGDSPEELARESSIGIVEDSQFEFKIYRSRSRVYYFAVSAITERSKESGLSEVIEVVVPSDNIPPLNIWPIAKEEQQVILNWQYPENIADLEGFNIYRNGELIETIPLDDRTWRSEDLDVGTYDYQVEAITTFGVSSGLSKTRTFKIE